jgi:hypothetical protein
LAVLRPSDEKERRRRPDIDITCLEKRARGGATAVRQVRHSYTVTVPGSMVSGSDEGDATECVQCELAKARSTGPVWCRAALCMVALWSRLDLGRDVQATSTHRTEA